MNMHQLVGPIITAVNPNTAATLLKSTGYTTVADGQRVPEYSTSTADVQVQAPHGKNLEHINALNIAGIVRVLFLNGGYWNGTVRVKAEGGDIIQFPLYGDTLPVSWLVVSAKNWPDWSEIIVVLQDD